MLATTLGLVGLLGELRGVPRVLPLGLVGLLGELRGVPRMLPLGLVGLLGELRGAPAVLPRLGAQRGVPRGLPLYQRIDPSNRLPRLLLGYLADQVLGRLF